MIGKCASRPPPARNPGSPAVGTALPYGGSIAAEPPPLLSSLPAPTQATLVVIVPFLAGMVTGFLLSETEAGWWLANLIALLGGIAGGYEHETARSGAKRGALAGVVFGFGIFLADAITDAAPIAEVPEPMILFPLIAAIGGVLAGSLGGRLRSRAAAR